MGWLGLFFVFLLENVTDEAFVYVVAL